MSSNDVSANGVDAIDFASKLPFRAGSQQVILHLSCDMCGANPMVSQISINVYGYCDFNILITMFIALELKKQWLLLKFYLSELVCLFGFVNFISITILVEPSSKQPCEQKSSIPSHAYQINR